MSYSLTTLKQGSSNETATDGMHPMLRTIQDMPESHRDIIGVCQQLPHLEDLQKLADEIYDGTVTVATDGSV
jgi:hypothetical protein